MNQSFQRLKQTGVAPWVDSIDREWLRQGGLRRLRDEFGIVGVTSNPTIFAKALGRSGAYDPDITRMAGEGLDPQAIFERLAVADVRSAADELQPVYQATGGLDGRVSFELPPGIADDTEASVAEAHRLFLELGRPNVFVKIPATAAGIPAIRRSIARGVNVNVTLIFALARYREVMEAYLTGLEERAARNLEIGHIASVASFFVSRVDGNVDGKLQRIIDQDGPKGASARSRLGTAAVNNAKLAYELFGRVFTGPRWDALAAKGAMVQRPLWASTSTKNPAYRDVGYVEELVGANTVNTMPTATIEAFADHGEVHGATATHTLSRAHTLWDELEELGIDETTVGWELERDGVKQFADSYQEAVQTVQAKLAAV